MSHAKQDTTFPQNLSCKSTKDLAGKDAIELGCGTAYVSAWLAQRGARVVGIDNSAVQLATARRLQQQYGLAFPLLHGNAEAVPYPDASFDFAISEYGACLWAEPQQWVPEAARLLRPGGRLVFLVNSFLMMLCMPAEDGVAATNHLLALRSACSVLNGLGISESSFTSRTGSGYDSCGVRDSRLKSWWKCVLRRPPQRATPS